jgi:hypothetical protein
MSARQIEDGAAMAGPFLAGDRKQSWCQLESFVRQASSSALRADGANRPPPELSFMHDGLKVAPGG